MQMLDLQKVLDRRTTFFKKSRVWSFGNMCSSRAHSRRRNPNAM